MVGSIPPVASYSTPRYAGGKKPAPAQPRFGSVYNGFMTKMGHVLPGITESFFAGFLVMDMGELWTSRAIIALKRDREAYKVNEDPKMWHQPFFVKWPYSLYRNIKGLNWPNFAEEFKRELQSGPILYIAQSVVLAWAMFTLLGKKGLGMSRSNLLVYTHLLKQVGQTSFKENPTAEDLYRHFTETLLKEKSSLKYKLDHTVKNVLAVQHPSDKALLEMINEVARHKNLSAENLTYGHLLDHWIHKDLIPYTGKKAGFWDKAYYQLAEKVESRLSQMVYWMNQSGEGLGNTTMKPTGYRNIILEDNWLEGHTNLENGKLTTNASEIIQNLRKFRSTIFDIHNLAHEKIHQGASKSNWPSLVTDACKTISRRGIIYKTVLSIGSTLLAVVLVNFVSKNAQSGKVYPANRFTPASNDKQHKLFSEMMSFKPHLGSTCPAPVFGGMIVEGGQKHG